MKSPTGKPTGYTPPRMYWRLLRNNRDFRLLYFGTLISLGGDWFLTVALLDLVLQLREDEFMNAFIEQLHIVSQGEIVMIPKVGRAEILFGKPERIAEKFENLKAFYSEVVAETGWYKYSTIDLRFRDQIICKKNPTS